MQRRAATAYALLFILLGGGALGLVVTADRPQVGFANPDYRLSQGDQFAVDGRQYTVDAVTGAPRSATLTWTNRSARYTTTWEHNATVTVDGEDRRVRVDANASTVVLVEQIDRAAVLRSDPQADNETVTRDGEEFVVVTANETPRLVPADEYFPAPDRTTYRAGDRFDRRGNRTTVESVTDAEARLAWTAPRTNEVAVSNEANVTLGGRQFVAFFPDDETLLLESNYRAYERQTDEVDRFVEHRNGLYGIAIVSGGAATLLAALAFLPSRY